MTRRQPVQSATHRCECGARVPVVRETPYEYAWRCGCGRAGLIAWAHANPAPQWDEREADLFGNNARPVAAPELEAV